MKVINGLLSGKKERNYVQIIQDILCSGADERIELGSIPKQENHCASE